MVKESKQIFLEVILQVLQRFVLKLENLNAFLLSFLNEADSCYYLANVLEVHKIETLSKY